MKVQSLGRANSMPDEPPRSTAYYYADLERFKRKAPISEAENHVTAPRLDDNDVINDAPITEVPPLRDRPSPEYQTPENSRIETYSTAGTFPMTEILPPRGPQREKEPLLSELEVIGRLPLATLPSNHGVRRSRSWYLCCPEAQQEARETSWRYASLPPVTQPPRPNGRPVIHEVASASSGAGADDARALRAERDALARALASERARAAAAARAHDARLAELHGVIAELVRRRAQDKSASAIPEEQLSDECESTTQLCGEIEEDGSRTEQNDTSSALSPETPQEAQDESSSTADLRGGCEAGASGASAESCARERGSPDAAPRLGWCEWRQAKVAARVRLPRAQDAHHAPLATVDEIRRALDEEIKCPVDTSTEDEAYTAQTGEWWRARALRLAGDRAVLSAALARATDTAHRLSCACAVQESSGVALCLALAAADRALEAYDVLLALAETAHQPSQPQRRVAETVARKLLARLESEKGPRPGGALLSPGPWLSSDEAWSYESEAGSEAGGSIEAVEAVLRSHAARLKADTVALRNARPPPAFFSLHDGEDDEAGSARGDDMADMEAAVALQEVLIAREAEAAARVAARASRLPPASHLPPASPPHCQTGSARRKHWLDAQQTDL